MCSQQPQKQPKKEEEEEVEIEIEDEAADKSEVTYSQSFVQESGTQVFYFHLKVACIFRRLSVLTAICLALQVFLIRFFILGVDGGVCVMRQCSYMSPLRGIGVFMTHKESAFLSLRLCVLCTDTLLSAVS